MWSRLSYTFQDEPKLTEAVADFPTTVNRPPTHQVSALLADRIARGPDRLEFRMSTSRSGQMHLMCDSGASRCVYAAEYGHRVSGSIKARSEIAFTATNLLDQKAQQHSFGDIIRRRVAVEYRVKF